MTSAKHLIAAAAAALILLLAGSAGALYVSANEAVEPASAPLTYEEAIKHDCCE